MHGRGGPPSHLPAGPEGVVVGLRVVEQHRLALYHTATTIEYVRHYDQNSRRVCRRMQAHEDDGCLTLRVTRRLVGLATLDERRGADT